MNQQVKCKQGIIINTNMKLQELGERKSEKDMARVMAQWIR